MIFQRIVGSIRAQSKGASVDRETAKAVAQANFKDATDRDIVSVCLYKICRTKIKLIFHIDIGPFLLNSFVANIADRRLGNPPPTLLKCLVYRYSVLFKIFL